MPERTLSELIAWLWEAHAKTEHLLRLLEDMRETARVYGERPAERLVGRDRLRVELERLESGAESSGLH